MKKTIGLFLILFFIGCIVPHANNNIYEFDKTLMGEKNTIVTKTFSGGPLLFSLLPLGEEPDMKTSLLEIMKEHKCSNLKNIEIEFYQKSFILVGFPRMIVTAHCIK